MFVSIMARSRVVAEKSADVADENQVLFGKMPNFGQVCIAPDNVLCHESKMDEFIESLKSNL